MTRVATIPFPWLSAFCGVKDSTDLECQALRLNLMSWDNAGYVRRTRGECKRQVISYLRRLSQSDRTGLVALQDVADTLGVPLSIVEEVCEEASLDVEEE